MRHPGRPHDESRVRGRLLHPGRGRRGRRARLPRRVPEPRAVTGAGSRPAHLMFPRELGLRV
ncbi:MAG: hypothetical protein F4Z33_01115 [Gemmatimonadales bacterium]|nr:hypothetical protein [Gemmatimonadales bacterium]MYC87419.1 hypothetical protein [Candidatus Palauibacter denitrificans]